MKIVAKCPACPARFSAKAPDADATRVRRLAAAFVENHERGESDSHRVKITETPPRIAAS
jgi:hypothetical protein